MKNHSILLAATIVLAGAFAWVGCKKAPTTTTTETPTEQGATTEMKPAETTTQAKSDEPQRIQVQHILIGFQGSLPGKEVKRSVKEAEKLAKEVLEKAQKGKPTFDELVKQYTDDQAPGIYGMANLGIPPAGEEFPRDQMVPAFGDVGFKLKVGEVGLAEFSETTSPYGYHVIKRLK